MSTRDERGLSRRELFTRSAAAGLGLVVYANTRTAFGQKKKVSKFITVSHSVNTSVYAPHMVAEAMGFFADEGLGVTFVVPGGGARVAQLVAGRQVGYGLGDSAHVLKISERGKPTEMILGTDTRCSYANIMVRKELWDQGLNTVEKLATMKRPGGEPRIIAATRIGSGTWVYGNYVLSQFHANGKSVNDQVKWIGGGGTTTMLGGLKSGQFDAIMCVPEWIDAAVGGGYGTVLFDVSSRAAWDRVFGANIPTTVGYALKETANEDEKVTQAYVTAMYRAMQWIKGRTPGEIYEKIGPKFMAEFKREDVEKTLKYYQNIFNYDLIVTPKDFAAGKKVWVPRATKKDWAYDEVVDMRFVKQAMKA
ncbi:MAG TPA: ABC transporter substrate-binding protein [bacterium]|nr:ABC transporter substrate-binding protein [bacterium]